MSTGQTGPALTPQVMQDALAHMLYHEIEADLWEPQAIATRIGVPKKTARMMRRYVFEDACRAFLRWSVGRAPKTSDFPRIWEETWVTAVALNGTEGEPWTPRFLRA